MYVTSDIVSFFFSLVIRLYWMQDAKARCTGSRKYVLIIEDECTFVINHYIIIIFHRSFSFSLSFHQHFHIFKS